MSYLPAFFRKKMYPGCKNSENFTKGPFPRFSKLPSCPAPNPLILLSENPPLQKNFGSDLSDAPQRLLLRSEVFLRREQKFHKGDEIKGFFSNAFSRMLLLEKRAEDPNWNQAVTPPVNFCGKISDKARSLRNAANWDLPDFTVSDSPITKSALRFTEMHFSA